MLQQTGLLSPWWRFCIQTAIQGRPWRHCGDRRRWRRFEGCPIVLSPALASSHTDGQSTSPPALGSSCLMLLFCCPSPSLGMAGKNLVERCHFCHGLLGFLSWKEMLWDYGSGFNKLIFGSGTRLSIQPSECAAFLCPLSKVLECPQECLVDVPVLSRSLFIGEREHRHYFI